MKALGPARTARLAGGAALAVASLVVVFALTTAPLPTRTQGPIALVAQPPATASVATCPGPVLAIGRDSTQAGQLTDAGAPQVTAASDDGAAPETRALVASDVAGGAGAAVLTAASAGTETPDLAAASSVRVGAPDLAGFAAAACTRATMQSWLPTGTATVGNADLVVLANPADVPALVTLTVYGAAGQTQPPAGEDIVVAAGSQRVIPLASLALGEENPVVRVSSTQAPVQASLQSALTRVLVPAGLDQVAAVGAPATDLVIAGVPVVVPPGEAGASDVSTSLRLLAPDADGTATVTVTSASGLAGAPQTVPLTAGAPLQLDLDGLQIGTYTVAVSASTPVTGAVRATAPGVGADFGWFTPAELLTAPTPIAIAPGSGAQLSVVARAGVSPVVTVASLDGSNAREITLAPGQTQVLDVTAGAVYRIGVDGAGVHAAVTYAGADGIAGYPVQPGDAAASAVTVYPR